jgi:Toprim domain
VRHQGNPFSRLDQAIPGSAAQLSRYLGGSAPNAAGWYLVRCPAHRDLRPSLSLKDGRFGLIAKCWAGCSSQDIKTALSELAKGKTFDRPAPPAPNVPAVDTVEIAARIWRESLPIGGSLAERYLRGRGITLPLPDTLRFHPSTYHKESGTFAPALVALVADADNEPRALHRIWIDASANKADLHPVKKSLGSTKGLAVRLGGPEHRIAIGEGVETVLAFRQLRGADALGGWATLGWPGLAAVALPDTVREVIVAGDNGTIGHQTAIELRDRLLRTGRQVSGCFPRDGLSDFNDVLQAKAMAA